jgi:5-methylcytosine-specific restriction endonuclease McrA
MSFKKNSLISAFDAGVRRCPICNVQLVWKSNTDSVQSNLATVDHIVPKSVGGSDTLGNMFVMCRK